MLSSELLAILVCPLCKGNLSPDDSRSTLDCPACALAYPVRDCIPVMLPSEASPIPGPPAEPGGS